MRAAAVDFVAAAAGVLSAAEVFAQLLPLLDLALREEPASLTSQEACPAPPRPSLSTSHAVVLPYNVLSLRDLCIVRRDGSNARV